MYTSREFMTIYGLLQTLAEPASASHFQACCLSAHARFFRLPHVNRIRREFVEVLPHFWPEIIKVFFKHPRLTDLYFKEKEKEGYHFVSFLLQFLLKKRNFLSHGRLRSLQSSFGIG